ncbi:MAG: hypothetical protein M0Q40_06595 [Limnochordia bacterium]|nr:hypothetical protein [Limnochordia bacterium]
MRFYRLSFLQEEPIVPMWFEHMRDVGQHSHEFYEIVIVLRGKATTMETRQSRSHRGICF